MNCEQNEEEQALYGQDKLHNNKERSFRPDQACDKIGNVNTWNQKKKYKLESDHVNVVAQTQSKSQVAVANVVFPVKSSHNQVSSNEH